MKKNSTENISEKLLARLETLAEVRLDEPLRGHTTFKTGGPADVLLFPKGVASLQEIIRCADDSGIALTIIGGGSNLLVSDSGIRGMVVCMRRGGEGGDGIESRGNGILYCDAGVGKKTFIEYCLRHGLEGMEFMTGIPGCLGGGIMMNAGTTLGNFVDILEGVDYVDRAGMLRSIAVKREMAHYRHMDIDEGAVITGASFRLRTSGDIARVRDIVKGILDERALKHPLDYPSAGSVFKNPPGHSSWKLVNDAGLKGFRIGGAMVSELHTNFIINFDKATSTDILKLIEHVRETVYSRFNVLLEPEVRLLGDFTGVRRLT
jgi:UDP-N-acetylmuramate dehydrogenase